jgi:hypothetical protein
MAENPAKPEKTQRAESNSLTPPVFLVIVKRFRKNASVRVS